MLQWLRDRARLLKREAQALYLAARDPRVPWYVKILAGTIAAYALSPIDLIPDFIPVIGLLDEIILLPLAIAAVLRLVDPTILSEHRQAAALAHTRPVSRIAAAVIIALWALCLLAVSAWLWL
jgi:uncharacterized membrane protein YkvA (DUF1232 family)